MKKNNYMNFLNEENESRFLYGKFQKFYKDSTLIRYTYEQFLMDKDVFQQMYIIYHKEYNKNLLRTKKIERILNGKQD